MSLVSDDVLSDGSVSPGVVTVAVFVTVVPTMPGDTAPLIVITIGGLPGRHELDVATDRLAADGAGHEVALSRFGDETGGSVSVTVVERDRRAGVDESSWYSNRPPASTVVGPVFVSTRSTSGSVALMSTASALFDESVSGVAVDTCTLFVYVPGAVKNVRNVTWRPHRARGRQLRTPARRWTRRCSRG